MSTSPAPTQEPNTFNTTATQSRAHSSSNPPKSSRLQLIKDIEGCRTGQWCATLYDGKIYPGVMRRVIVALQYMQIVGQHRFRWRLKDDTAEFELQ